MSMDEKDVRILYAIASERTGSPEAIQETTGIPKSTVHYRLEKLRERGVLQNDLNDVDIEEVGLSLTVITEVFAEFGEGYHDDVGGKIADIEGVNQVYFTMDDTDFVVISHLTGHERVEQLIERFEAINEIERTSSKFVITTVKDERNPICDFELDTLLDLLAE